MALIRDGYIQLTIKTKESSKEVSIYFPRIIIGIPTYRHFAVITFTSAISNNNDIVMIF